MQGPAPRIAKRLVSRETKRAAEVHDSGSPINIMLGKVASALKFIFLQSSRFKKSVTF